MHADWIQSSNGLPREGQQIEFLLDFRNVAMEGCYTHQAFQSHWAEYDIDRVRSWRKVREVCDLIIPAPYVAARVLETLPSGYAIPPISAAGGVSLLGSSIRFIRRLCKHQALPLRKLRQLNDEIESSSIPLPYAQKNLQGRFKIGQPQPSNQMSSLTS